MTFKDTLGLWLKDRATTDAEFAKDFAKENKNIEDCTKFIEATMLKKVMAQRSQAKDNSQCSVAAPSDDEVFALALEYYRNDDIQIKPINGDMVKILSMSATTFTEEEKAKMREEAKGDFIAHEKAKNVKINTPKPATPKPAQQPKVEKPKAEAKQVEMKPKAAPKKNVQATQLSLF